MRNLQCDTTGNTIKNHKPCGKDEIMLGSIELLQQVISCMVSLNKILSTCTKNKYTRSDCFNAGNINLAIQLCENLFFHNMG